MPKQPVSKPAASISEPAGGDLLNFDASPAQNTAQPNTQNSLVDMFSSAPADDGFSDFQANNSTTNVG